MDNRTTDLLECVVDAPLAVLKDTLEVLMAHVHDIVNREADEDDD